MKYKMKLNIKSFTLCVCVVWLETNDDTNDDTNDTILVTKRIKWYL